MTEEKLEPFERAINSIDKTSWDREKETSEFQDIHDTLYQLREKISDRHAVTKEGPITQMAYEVSFYLLDVAKEVMIDPDTIADTETENTLGRSLVSLNLARALEDLHISTEEIAAAREKVKEQRAKKLDPDEPTSTAE